jgi:cytochrome c oxidase subunit 2
MTGLIAIASVVLLGVVAVQIGKISDIFAKIRGEEASQHESNLFNGRLGMFFVVAFLIFCVASAWYYKDDMLGYGPHVSASEHGGWLDWLFNITLFFTGIVFVLTHLALFWFAYKYRGEKGRKALYIVHDNKLEIIWTAIPAVVMFGLVISGLWVWNNAMDDIKEGESYMEIEATASQFLWEIRYPGKDGALGTKNYKLIVPGKNSLGQDWRDPKNLDDFLADEVVLPVGKKVRVRITAKDVLHNFDLPHFRVKMDAIPGLPTYFVFTPKLTTEQYRLNLKKSKDQHAPYDAAEPNGPKRWEKFEYELACAELCGNGHFSMRKIVKIVSQAEYDKWAAAQTSYYDQNVKGKEWDTSVAPAPAPEPAATTAVPAAAPAPAEFSAAAVEKAAAGATLQLNHVTFATASSALTPESSKELDIVVDLLKKNPKMTVEVAGHTDNAGDKVKNKKLSEDRAKSVEAYVESKGIAKDRMESKGFGDEKPLVPNTSAENKQKNRRTEFKILTK